MIQALELRNQLAFALDAEGSDHYRDDQDYIPAINGAIKSLTAIINSALGQNKLGEEFFREISYSGVFRTDLNSRISLSVFPNEVWSILAIYPKPNTSGTVIPTPLTTRSYYMDGLLHVSADKDCKRLTIEEWSKNKLNPLEAGYDGNQICDDLKRYAYLNPINYGGVNSGFNSQELEIRPKLENLYATVFWAKMPTVITDINDNIEFPSSCFPLLFNKALNYIAYKQGDSTNLYSVSNADIQQLLSLI
jgi:hypothetical protein